MQPAIYMMANERNGVIYTGVTSNLVKRIYEHRNSIIEGFTKKYGCKTLVFYELHATMESAITREKQIKGGSRKDKILLIEGLNESWRDLYDDILNEAY